MLNGKEKNLTAAGQIIEEMKELLWTRQESKVMWVRRTGNKAAHELAREGVCLELSKFWLAEPPDCILQIVSDEIPNMF